MALDLARACTRARSTPWDGYGYERKQILDHVLDNDVQNVVAITGDIHTFFAGTAYTTGDKSTGRAASPSSSAAPPPQPGCRRRRGSPATTLAALVNVNPHIKFFDFVKRGYGVIEFSPTEAVCELKAVDAKTPGASTPTTIAKFRAPLGAREPEQIA